ncbi:hypothetical protein CEXT_296911 [Caerostris extrusa]|uniref:Uncharacterized protein n=1 Tax=Caerostris extrusa TaxID=172846 RepID=A0AAV4TX87_CAEEX|nr:hypothetical protein CEXT_296911 [Caerostris extrusa]
MGNEIPSDPQPQLKKRGILKGAQRRYFNIPQCTILNHVNLLFCAVLWFDREGVDRPQTALQSMKGNAFRGRGGCYGGGSSCLFSNEIQKDSLTISEGKYISFNNSFS